jgi:hypothetical protein
MSALRHFRYVRLRVDRLSYIENHILNCVAMSLCFLYAKCLRLQSLSFRAPAPRLAIGSLPGKCVVSIVEGGEGSLLEARTCDVFLGVLDQETTIVSETSLRVLRTNSLVPEDCRYHGPQMPQAVSIDHAPPRRKIHQLQTHRRDDPCHADTRKHRPRAPNPLVLHITEATPEQVGQGADHDISCHVVCIVPAPQRQVANVQDVQQNAQRSPQPQHTLLPWIIAVEAKNADGRVVQPVQHIRTRSPIVQLLRDTKVTGVEDHAEGPASQAHVTETEVVFAQGVGSGDLVAQLRHAPVVREVVEQREDDAKGLLKAHEPVKGPFAVELVYGLHVRRVACKALRSYDVLAGVVAFGGTIPEEEAAVEG